MKEPLNHSVRHSILPLGELSRAWEKNFSIDLDPYLKAFPIGAKKTLVLDTVSLTSPLFEDLRDQVLSKGLIPEFVINADDFVSYSELIAENIERGVQFAVLIFQNLSVNFFARLKEFEGQKRNIKFVLIARKDWRVRDGFRSLPFAIRNQVFVDFPCSLHSGDVFFSVKEKQELVEQLKKDFRMKELRSYAPDLRFYSRQSFGNIQTLEEETSLQIDSVKVSVVIHHKKELDLFLQKPWSDQLLSSTEFLILRTPKNQEFESLPEIPGAFVNYLSVKLREQNQPVSMAWLDNFALTKASGEMVLFPHRNNQNLRLKDLESDLGSGIKDLKSLQNCGWALFRKDSLKSVGGFDALFENKILSNQDAFWKCLDFEGQDPKLKTQEQMMDVLGDQWSSSVEKEVFSHRYLRPRQVEKESRPLVGKGNKEQLKRIYLPLMQTSPRVFFEGNFKALLGWLGELFLWRLDPKTYPLFWKLKSQAADLFWRLDPNAYPFFWKIKGFFTSTLNPNSYAWYWKTKGFLSHRFNVKSYDLFWRVRHFIQTRLWKLHPRQVYWLFYRLYWFMYQLSFPFRKVYYFGHFQYEKRILGLHRSADSRQG